MVCCCGRVGLVRVVMYLFLMGFKVVVLTSFCIASLFDRVPFSGNGTAVMISE